MTWLIWLAVFWFIAAIAVCVFMYGARIPRSCTGNCYQGRKKCNCGKYD